jgi:hypothetical protein
MRRAMVTRPGPGCGLRLWSRAPEGASPNPFPPSLGSECCGVSGPIKFILP